MRVHNILPIVLVAVAFSTTRAQRPEPQGTKGTKAPAAREPVEWVALAHHTEDESRRAFAACDADGDDRLSIFEASRALPGLSVRDDPKPFRGIDTSSDGYIEWPEFDAFYRKRIRRGSPFRFRPARPFARATPKESAKSSAANALIGKLDQDGDGKLTVAELRKFITGANLPPPIQSLLMALDADSSGEISPAELLPVVQLMPQQASPAAPAQPKTGGQGLLPPDLRPADTNGDGVLDAGELRKALVHIHPSLGRWTAVIVQRADKSGNGSLGPAEILGARRATSQRTPR